jgi:hypothetical protein
MVRLNPLLIAPGDGGARDYPGRAAADEAMLVPAYGPAGPGPSLIVPAPDADRAIQMCLAWSASGRDQTHPFLRYAGELGSATVGEFAEPDFAVEALGAYAERIEDIRQKAYDVSTDLAKRVKAGAKLTAEDLNDLRLKRADLGKALTMARPPVFRMNILSPDEFRHEFVPEHPSHHHERWQRRRHKKLSAAQAKVQAQAIAVPAKWARRFAVAGTILTVIDFVSHAAEVISADTVEELNSATIKLVRQGAEVTASLAGTAAAGALTKMGLAVALSVTPAGWVVFGVGFLAGAAAGVFAGDAAEMLWRKNMPLRPH